MKMKRMKLTAAASVVGIILVLVLLISLSCTRSQKSRLVEVVKGPFHIKVHAVGQLKSAASIHVGCPPIRRLWNYTISFMAPEGKEVKAGDLILSFDAKELMERMQLKQSELNTAQKELEKIRLVEQEKKENLELQLAEARVKTQKAKQQTKQPEEYVAMNELKKLRMDLELAEMREKLIDSRVKNQISGMKTRIYTQQAKVKRLESRVRELQSSIAKMKVKAPKAGMVVYALDWEGNKKVVGDRCWRGSNIMELPDLTKMQVKAVIPEPQAGKVKIGLGVEIRLDSNPDRVFKGKVKDLGRIFRTRSHDQPAIVFDATIDILDPDPELMRPGMAAGFDIIVSSRENVLQVPEAVVIYHEKGLFVWKKGFVGKKMVPVTIGARSGAMVEVLEGLKENDRVLIRTSGERAGTVGGAGVSGENR
jgi:multidrug efflux pump subunit AcrA (membrane-fusion protein)